MATAVAASAAAIALWQYTRSQRSSMFAACGVQPPAVQSIDFLTRVERAPNTWVESLYFLREVLRLMYSETLGRWHTVDLFVGLAYLSHKEQPEYAAADIASKGVPVSLMSNTSEELQAMKDELLEIRKCMLYCRGLKFKKQEQQARFWMDNCGIDVRQILVQQATAGLLRPAYVLVRDDALQKVILCIRGTQSLKDLFTSLTGATKPHHVVRGPQGVTLGYSHLGMLAAARWLQRQVTPMLKEALDAAGPGYELRIVGHSMGAGTAVMLTMMLRDMCPELAHTKCIAIACPACMTVELASSCKGYVTSVINNTDIVPTFCAASVDALREDVTASSWFAEFQRDLRASMVRVLQGGVRGLGSATRWTANNILSPAAYPLTACYTRTAATCRPGFFQPPAPNTIIRAGAGTGEPMHDSVASQNLSHSSPALHTMDSPGQPGDMGLNGSFDSLSEDAVEQALRSCLYAARQSGAGGSMLQGNNSPGRRVAAGVPGSPATRQSRRRLWPWGIDSVPESPQPGMDMGIREPLLPPSFPAELLADDTAEDIVMSTGNRSSAPQPTIASQAAAATGTGHAGQIPSRRSSTSADGRPSTAGGLLPSLSFLNWLPSDDGTRHLAPSSVGAAEQQHSTAAANLQPAVHGNTPSAHSALSPVSNQGGGIGVHASVGAATGHGPAGAGLKKVQSAGAMLASQLGQVGKATQTAANAWSSWLWGGAMFKACKAPRPGRVGASPHSTVTSSGGASPQSLQQAVTGLLGSIEDGGEEEEEELGEGEADLESEDGGQSSTQNNHASEAAQQHLQAGISAVVAAVTSEADSWEHGHSGGDADRLTREAERVLKEAGEGNGSGVMGTGSASSTPRSMGGAPMTPGPGGIPRPRARSASGVPDSLRVGSSPPSVPASRPQGQTTPTMNIVVDGFTIEAPLSPERGAGVAPSASSGAAASAGRAGQQQAAPRPAHKKLYPAGRILHFMPLHAVQHGSAGPAAQAGTPNHASVEPGAAPAQQQMPGMHHAASTPITVSQTGQQHQNSSSNAGLAVLGTAQAQDSGLEQANQGQGQPAGTMSASTSAPNPAPWVLLQVDDHTAYGRVKLCKTMVMDHFVHSYLVSLDSVVDQLTQRMQQHESADSGQANASDAMRVDEAAQA